MKIGWLFKPYNAEDSWVFNKDEPEYCYDKIQIVYSEITDASPGLS